MSWIRSNSLPGVLLLLLVSTNLPAVVPVRTPVSPVSVTHRPDGAFFLDFGKDAFSQLELTMESASAATVTVHIGEAASRDSVRRNPGANIRYRSAGIEVSPGRHTYIFPLAVRKSPVPMPESIGEVFPFRYCEIEGLDGEVTDARQLAVHCPFDDSASMFESSDTVLNKVWDLCKYSIKATSFCGLYVDGDRERLPYEADALINQLSHYCVDNEYGMARATAEYLAENPTWPTEWNLQMVLIAWYDYLYSGDRTFLEQNYDLLMKKTLCDLTEDNGLVSTRTGKVTPEFLKALRVKGKFNDIVDWPRSGAFGIGKEEAGEADGFVFTDYNAVVNAFHYEALVKMALVSDALGRRSDSRMLRRRASAVLEAFNGQFFDAGSGCYRDGIGTGHHSLHANMFPLAFGMVPEERLPSVLEFIRSRGMACSVYGAQFLMEGLYRAGESDYALSLLCSTSVRSWYNMIRCGSTITMEAWDTCFKNNLDWNHAWGAAPANIIPRKIAGVEPVEPAFRKVSICPQPAGLEWFRALVPSPEGGISCGYRGVSENESVFNFVIPEGIKCARISLPSIGKGERLTVNGHSRPVRRKEGRVRFRLGPGEWECRLSVKE